MTKNASQASKPNGEIWARIVRQMSELRGIKTQLVLVPGHPKAPKTFIENPAAYLITICHQRACRLCKNTEQSTESIIIPQIETGILEVN